MAKFAGLRDPVTLDFEGSTLAYCVDAITISVGSLLGTSPVTAFIESATGIAGAFVHGSIYYFLVCHLHIPSRGWKDGHHCRRHGINVLRLSLLRPSLCLHPIVGHWWRARHCGIIDDQKVCRLLVLHNALVRRVNRHLFFPLHPLASVRSTGTTSGTLRLRF